MKGWLVQMEKRIRRLFYGEQDCEREMRARQTAHELANEVQQLKAVVNIIKRSPDPWEELVRAIRHENGDHHGVRH